MKRKILGAREKACDSCGGTMMFLEVKGMGLVSQCRNCGSCVSGRVKEEVRIYTYEGGNEWKKFGKTSKDMKRCIKLVTMEE